MKRYRMAAAVCAALVGLGTAGACSDEPATPTVPRLAVSGSAGTGEGTGDQENPNAVGGDSSAGRRARLHAAAQCIREHGVPGYPDPLLTADGYVYTDEVNLRELEEAEMTAIDTACGELIQAAQFSMKGQGPPPPKVIQAGVRSAQCMRANGLPDYKDPTVDSPFVPGKGFGLDPSSIPAGGKADPTVRRALDACRAVLDAEAAASSLGSLGNA